MVHAATLHVASCVPPCASGDVEVGDPNCRDAQARAACVRDHSVRSTDSRQVLAKIQLISFAMVGNDALGTADAIYAAGSGSGSAAGGGAHANVHGMSASETRAAVAVAVDGKAFPIKAPPVLSFANGDPIAQAIMRQHERVNARAAVAPTTEVQRDRVHANVAIGGSMETSEHVKARPAPPADGVQQPRGGLTLEQLGVTARTRALARGTS